MPSCCSFSKRASSGFGCGNVQCFDQRTGDPGLEKRVLLQHCAVKQINAPHYHPCFMSKILRVLDDQKFGLSTHGKVQGGSTKRLRVKYCIICQNYCV